MRTMKLAALGMALGCAASLVAGRVMQTLLFGVTPSDPVTFAAAQGETGIEIESGGGVVRGVRFDKYTCYPCLVAQLNLYLAEKRIDELRAEAVRQGLSLSRYVAILLDTKRSVWPADYFTTCCGFLSEDLPAPADPLPEAVEWR